MNSFSIRLQGRFTQQMYPYGMTKCADKRTAQIQKVSKKESING
jgi:hypothetical protein